MAQEKFSYQTQPHAAPVTTKNKQSKGKYRDDEMEGSIGNLMNDPRVIRGSTYAAKGGNELSKSKSGRNDPPLSKKKTYTKRGSTPPPVEGRSHMDMQTDDFLEELTDRPIEIDQETQTQPYMDRPASPLFVRACTGQDMETQILPGDLFDFDLEVEPLLEVLVGKSIHVAMLELMQEEELEAIRLQQEEFENIRNVELAEIQRLEAESRRRSQEKERRVAQERKRVAEKRALEEKITARSFAHSYLGDLHNNVFDQLQSEGLFYDPVHKEIEDIFMADLVSEIKRRADSYNAAQQMANEILENVRIKAKLFEIEANKIREENAAKERARIAAEAEARRIAEEERLAAEKAAAELTGENGEVPSE